jgi:hypothetical protein
MGPLPAYLRPLPDRRSSGRAGFFAGRRVRSGSARRGDRRRIVYDRRGPGRPTGLPTPSSRLCNEGDRSDRGVTRRRRGLLAVGSVRPRSGSENIAARMVPTTSRRPGGWSKVSGAPRTIPRYAGGPSECQQMSAFVSARSSVASTVRQARRRGTEPPPMPFSGCPCGGVGTKRASDVRRRPRSLRRGA